MTDKIVYTAQVHTTGGREGAARSSDGRLDILLASPGSSGTGTNPEQLFAAGWSACFEGAMGLAAKAVGAELPDGYAIDAEVDLCHGDNGYFLRARLDITLPGMTADLAQQIIDKAHETCPYSKAVRGNVETAVTLA